jgi:hypothetical protein
MASAFAFKAALRKSMLKTLRGLTEAQLQSQCELVWTPPPVPRVLTARSPSGIRSPHKCTILQVSADSGMLPVDAKGGAADG